MRRFLPVCALAVALVLVPQAAALAGTDTRQDSDAAQTATVTTLEPTSAEVLRDMLREYRAFNSASLEEQDLRYDSGVRRWERCQELGNTKCTWDVWTNWYRWGRGQYLQRIRMLRNLKMQAAVAERCVRSFDRSLEYTITVSTLLQELVFAGVDHDLEETDSLERRLARVANRKLLRPVCSV
jgi:hypothetical protein